MAPAAAQAISAHLRETGRNLTDYTWIVTGDLGEVGRSLVCRLLEEEGFYPDSRLTDCGLLLFDNHAQDTHSGGSGCACSAITYGAYFHPRLQTGGHRLLLVPTGALMNLTVSQQGESIPGMGVFGGWFFLSARSSAGGSYKTDERPDIGAFCGGWGSAGGAGDL